MRLVGAASFLLAVVIGVTGTSQQAVTKHVRDMTPQDEEEFAKASESTMEPVCILCHPFENIVKTRRSMKEWDEQVVLMAGRGAPGNEKDFALVKRYLTRYYGVVRINTAAAEEISSVLGLSEKAANAIVEYRKANGRIPDVATLLKIDGVDKAKIEEQPEALRFD